MACQGCKNLEVLFQPWLHAFVLACVVMMLESWSLRVWPISGHVCSILDIHLLTVSVDR